jgi:hypothetical protein
MEKLKMHSANLTQDNIARIRDLFPSCITEAKGKDGSVKLAVDFDQLRQELADSLIDGPQERYHLTWPGKREALLTSNAPIAKTLRPKRAESVNFDTTKNIFIEGDNLDALKLLQETYLGKVKLIYIDPPYNTGNDFIYEDDFSETVDSYISKSLQADEQGNKLIANTESNGRFHSDWLSMIYPRIKLSRTLLTDDGSMFISIDDNEVHNLRKICDEIFGEGNLVAQICHKARASISNDKIISSNHNHILWYAKSLDALFARRSEIGLDPDLTGFSNPDNDPRGPWKPAPVDGPGGAKKGNPFYEFIDLFVDNIKPDRTPEDLLFQVMLDWGVDLALPITKQSIQGKDVFFVDGNALAACFDASGSIDEAFVKELAKHAAAARGVPRRGLQGQRGQDQRRADFQAAVARHRSEVHLRGGDETQIQDAGLSDGGRASRGGLLQGPAARHGGGHQLPHRPGQGQERVEDLFAEGGFKNADLKLTDIALLENISQVQRQQNLPSLRTLVKTKVSRVNLDIEMETGTGKTYCYIKTIFELNKQYGWSKFIIVVPSIAIREGVAKSLEITAEHFLETYQKKARFFIYNSKQLHHLESFSSDAGINVMVINVQAFNATGQGQPAHLRRAGRLPVAPPD